MPQKEEEPGPPGTQTEESLGWALLLEAPPPSNGRAKCAAGRRMLRSCRGKEESASDGGKQETSEIKDE